MHTQVHHRELGSQNDNLLTCLWEPFRHKNNGSKIHTQLREGGYNHIAKGQPKVPERISDCTVECGQIKRRAKCEPQNLCLVLWCHSVAYALESRCRNSVGARRWMQGRHRKICCISERLSQVMTDCLLEHALPQLLNCAMLAARSHDYPA